MKSASCPEDVPLPIRRPGFTRAWGEKCRPGLVYKMPMRRSKDLRDSKGHIAIPCHSLPFLQILTDFASFYP